MTAGEHDRYFCYFPSIENSFFIKILRDLKGCSCLHVEVHNMSMKYIILPLKLWLSNSTIFIGSSLRYQTWDWIPSPFWLLHLLSYGANFLRLTVSLGPPCTQSRNWVHACGFSSQVVRGRMTYHGYYSWFWLLCFTLGLTWAWWCLRWHHPYRAWVRRCLILDSNNKFNFWELYGKYRQHSQWCLPQEVIGSQPVQDTEYSSHPLRIY